MFKDAGARVIAHKNATARLTVLKDPHTVLPDQSIDDKKVIKLGGTTLELYFLGINHSDSNIVLRLPKEKLIFVVDTIPVGAFPGRGFIDISPPEDRGLHQEGDRDGLGALIPGHPGAPNGRLGTKQDARGHPDADAGGLCRDEKRWRRTASAGEPAEKEFKMPKYANLPGYENGLQFVARHAIAVYGAAAPEIKIPFGRC